MGNILQQMLLKDRHQRLSLPEVREAIGHLLDKYE
jgi:hypothetical protein